MAATTDFVSAQQVNRRNTMVLLAALTALAALLGYLIGWVLETEASNTVPLWSISTTMPTYPRHAGRLPMIERPEAIPHPS